jgi:dihydrofolate reductase
VIISIIVAVSRNGVIGVNNQIPWHLPDDLKYFRRLTTGHHVIMGRKTYASIGKALPSRTNLVVTRNRDFWAEGIQVHPSLDHALSVARLAAESEAFVIGGSEIYRLALPLAHRLYYTRVDTWVEQGHAFFPEPDETWNLVQKQDHAPDERHAFAFSFETYERQRPIREEDAGL